MVVMNLDAYTTLAAMERPWWPQHLAGVAVAQLILFFLWLHIASTIVDIWIKNLGEVLKFSKVEKFINAVGYAHLLKL